MQRKPHKASTSDVVVARVHGQSMAQMWAELLGNHGIASRLSPVSGIVDTVYPTDTVYELLVTVADAPRARAILPPQANERRIRSQSLTRSEDELLDEIDHAIAMGDMDLAEELLSLIDPSNDADTA